MANTLVNHIKDSLEKTDYYNSKITHEILKMEGMSGKKTRHFYNNICSMYNARYLEIGTWKGSSVCSSMCNNKIECICIDNWSEFGGPKDEFLENFNKFKGENNAKFIEKNCWDIDVNTLGKFNIYMYDGNHTETSHFQALNHYLSCLDNEFIYLVDDWNWDEVRKGTLQSIKDNNLKIIYQKEILTNNGEHPPWGEGDGIRAGKDGDWHNGISIFVLHK
jgi:hypothetical protein